MKEVQYTFGDEFGDTADDPKIDEDGYYNPSRFFGYGISVPYSSEDFANIRVRLEEFDTNPENWKRKNKEIKTRRLPKTKQTWLAKTISRNADSFVYTVDKMSDVPEGWDEYTSAERMVALALYSMCDVLNRVDSHIVNFVFDSHTALETPWAYEFIRTRLDRISRDTGRVITFVTRSSSNSEFEKQLQVTDAISYFSLSSLDRGKRHNAKKARVVFEHLDGTDSIWYDDLFDYSRNEASKVISKNCLHNKAGPSLGMMVSLNVMRR